MGADLGGRAPGQHAPVTMMVTPCSARAVMRLQKSRRAIGSAPLVASSRNRISGWCSRAQAIASLCL